MTTKRATKTSTRKPEPAAPADPPQVTFRKRDLIEQVTAETGLKRRDVKAISEAVLAAMGRAVGEGQSLALEPLGKLRVARTNESGASRVLTCKLRQKAAAVPGE